MGLTLAGCLSRLDFSEECHDDQACASLGEALICQGGQCVDPGGASPPPRDLGVHPSPDAQATGLADLRAQGCTLIGAGGDARSVGALIPPNAQEPALAALRMAVDEINAAGGFGGRAFSVLACPEADPGTTRRRAQRMAEEITEPAIAGPSSAALAAEVYGALRPFGVVLLTLDGTEPTRSALGDPGLLWHARASARASAEAAGRIAGHLDVDRLAIVHRADAWGEALAAEVEARRCEGACAPGMVGRFAFDPLTDEVLEAVGAARAFGAELLVPIGRSTDSVSLYAALADLEVGATLGVEGPHRPTDLAALLSLDAEGQSRLPPWRLALRRALLCVGGTVNSSGRGPGWDDWVARLAEVAPDVEPTPEAALLTDAIYTLAYAVAAAGEGEITGLAIAGGITRLVRGAPILVGGAGWTEGLAALAEGGFDLEGASSGLRFDPETGEVRGAVEIWWYDGTSDGIAPGGEVLDDRGGFTPPAARPLCDEE